MSDKPPVTKVVVADDHPVVREGVVAVLAKHPSLRVVAEAPTADQALKEVARHLPEVLVIDVRLGELDGIDACAQVTTDYPHVKTLVLTRFAHESVMVRAFAAGAKGFLIKDSSPDTIRHAVLSVAAGNTFVDSKVADKLVDLATKGRLAKGPYELSITEMRVLEMLPKGLSNREIGEELSVSHETVKTHVRHIMEKLQVHDRSEAAAIAIREGLA